MLVENIWNYSTLSKNSERLIGSVVAAVLLPGFWTKPNGSTCRRKSN
jgi:hypothetical protein